MAPHFAHDLAAIRGRARCQPFLAIYASYATRICNGQDASRDSKPGRRGTYLLTGILRCMDCGGSLTMIDQRCYGCGTRNRAGDAACDNGIRIRCAHLEDRFLSEVRQQLHARAAVRWAEREIAKRLTAPPIDTCDIRLKLAAIDGDVVQVVDAIARVGISDALESKLADLEAQKQDLTDELQAASKTVRIPDIAAIAAKDVRWSRIWVTRRSVQRSPRYKPPGTPLSPCSERFVLTGTVRATQT